MLSFTFSCIFSCIFSYMFSCIFLPLAFFPTFFLHIFCIFDAYLKQILVDVMNICKIIAYLGDPILVPGLFSSDGTTCLQHLVRSQSESLLLSSSSSIIGLLLVTVSGTCICWWLQAGPYLSFNLEFTPPSSCCSCPVAAAKPAEAVTSHCPCGQGVCSSSDTDLSQQPAPARRRRP
jgi:hypothetical protein